MDFFSGQGVEAKKWLVETPLERKSKLSLAAAAAAAAAGASDLVFVEGKGQSNYSTRVFKIFEVGNVQLSC